MAVIDPVSGERGAGCGCLELTAMLSAPRELASPLLSSPWIHRGTFGLQRATVVFTLPFCQRHRGSDDICGHLERFFGVIYLCVGYRGRRQANKVSAANSCNSCVDGKGLPSSTFYQEPK